MTKDGPAHFADEDPASDPAGTQDITDETVGEESLNQRGGHEEWRAEFPYRWRTDDLVTRRDTLRFLVAGSSALFLATGALAVVGNVAPLTSGAAIPIARVGELAENEWKVFDYPDQYAQGMLINLPGKGLVAYSDVCTHLSCAVLYSGDGKHLHCPCHNGLFDAATGAVLAGPPIRPLPLIELAIHDGVIYAIKQVSR